MTKNLTENQKSTLSLYLDWYKQGGSEFRIMSLTPKVKQDYRLSSQTALKDNRYYIVKLLRNRSLSVVTNHLDTRSVNALIKKGYLNQIPDSQNNSTYVINQNRLKV